MAASTSQRILQLMGKARKPMKLVNFEARAFALALRSSTLSPVKSVKIEFDPFHERCTSIRDITYAFSSPTLRDTNLKCGFSVDVKSDLSEPKLTVDFNDGEKAVFKTANLSATEIMKIFNKLSLEKAPVETSSLGQQTKSTNSKPKPKKK